MTLLTYSPVPGDYKLDTYQDTCVKQLMIVKQKASGGFQRQKCKNVLEPAVQQPSRSISLFLVNSVGVSRRINRFLSWHEFMCSLSHRLTENRWRQNGGKNIIEIRNLNKTPTDGLLSSREKTHVSVSDNDGYREHVFCLYRSRFVKRREIRIADRGGPIGVLLCHFAPQNASMCPTACKKGTCQEKYTSSMGNVSLNDLFSTKKNKKNKYIHWFMKIAVLIIGKYFYCLSEIRCDYFIYYKNK